MADSRRKQGISRSFSDAAAGYDQWAQPQREAAARLMGMVSDSLPAGPVLDVGCGTGLLTELLVERYPDRRIVGVDVAPAMVDTCRARWEGLDNVEFVVADAERFDSLESWALVASSFSFQWFDDQEAALLRLRDQLAPGGVVALAVPVDGSLEELHQSREVEFDAPMPWLDFAKADTYERALAESGLRVRRFETGLLETLYDSAWDVLRSFKGIGATMQHQNGYAPLPAAGVRRLVETYQRLHARPDGRVPLTYRALYCVAERNT